MNISTILLGILSIGFINTQILSYTNIFESREKGYIYTYGIFGENDPQKQALILDTTSQYTKIICNAEELILKERLETSYNSKKSKSFEELDCNTVINGAKCQKCIENQCHVQYVLIQLFRI